MHELGFMLLGAWIGSLVTVGMLALMRSAKDADEWYEGYSAGLDDEIVFTPAPYDWREEGL